MHFRNSHEEDGSDVVVYVICPAANSGNGGGDGPIEGDRGRDILEDAVIACWTQIAYSRSRRGQYLSNSGRELI